MPFWCSKPSVAPCRSRDSLRSLVCFLMLCLTPCFVTVPLVFSSLCLFLCLSPPRQPPRLSKCKSFCAIPSLSFSLSLISIFKARNFPDKLKCWDKITASGHVFQKFLKLRKIYPSHCYAEAEVFLKIFYTCRGFMTEISFSIIVLYISEQKWNESPIDPVYLFFRLSVNISLSNHQAQYVYASFKCFINYGECSIVLVWFFLLLFCLSSDLTCASIFYYTSWIRIFLNNV